MKSKIQDLLERAERQKGSDETEQNSVAGAERRFSSSVEAQSFFEQSKAKLLQIERWNAKSALNHYRMFDRHGAPKEEAMARVGDFVQISMRGALKNDWVKIIALEILPDEAVLTVQPAPDPTEKNNEENVTSHFFTDEATNNFCLERKNETVRFYVVGLNEKSNTTQTGGVLESVRNFGVANVGSLLGIQKAEWQTFCERFLETENEK